MVETTGSVKLFGTTIEVAAERETPAKGVRGGETELSGEFRSMLKQKPRVKIKGKEQEPRTPKESSERAASSMEMEHGERVPADEAGKQDGKKAPFDPQEKQLQKKPTKILPCPRCHSLDTKFCYFNNYNVNQPRHLCRACQRYWTDGGAMRNMPVGAGRRKSKSSSSQLRHVTLYGAAAALHGIPSNILEEACGRRTEQSPDRATPPFPNGMMPPHNPKDRRLNIDENLIGRLRGEEEKLRADIADAVQASSSTGDGIKREPGALHAPPYPYLDGSSSPSTWNPPPHALCAPYLTPSTGCRSTPPGPAVLGKHSRDGSILGRSHRVMACDGWRGRSDERGQWFRKATRSDDPSEASGRSAWDDGTGGKGAASGGSCFRGGVFATFQPKPEIANANPVALLRSLEFHENVQWRNDVVNARR